MISFANILYRDIGKNKVVDYGKYGSRFTINFIPKDDADTYYTTLLYNTPWREYEMLMYDKILTAPRMIAWYGSPDEAGKSALPWIP